MIRFVRVRRYLASPRAATSSPWKRPGRTATCCCACFPHPLPRTDTRYMHSADALLSFSFFSFISLRFILFLFTDVIALLSLLSQGNFKAPPGKGKGSQILNLSSKGLIVFSDEEIAMFPQLDCLLVILRSLDNYLFRHYLSTRTTFVFVPTHTHAQTETQAHAHAFMCVAINIYLGSRLPPPSARAGFRKEESVASISGVCF